MPEGTVPRLHPAPLGDGEQSGGLKVINGHGSGLVDYLYSIGHAGWAVMWETPSNGPRADPPYPWGTSFIRHTTSGSHPPDPVDRPTFLRKACKGSVKAY
jgi:hypothetical protein